MTMIGGARGCPKFGSCAAHKIVLCPKSQLPKGLEARHLPAVVVVPAGVLLFLLLLWNFPSRCVTPSWGMLS